ncbi:MAG: methylated-DNA--[protein]-cysteine S-methyltransferase [Patescibacteria group bacterium]
MAQNFYQHVYQMVKKVPKGKVATYGQIAALIGSPRSARMVGWALHEVVGAKSKVVPWQRVINREGRISIVNLAHPAQEQAYLLIKEGVKVKEKEGNYYVDLDKYLWQPKKKK